MDRISFAIVSYVQRETYKSMINYSDSFTISITEVNAALQFDWRWPLHRLCLGTIFVNLLFWVRLHNRRFPTISYCVRSGEWIKSCMTRGFIKWWRLLSNSLIHNVCVALLLILIRCLSCARSPYATVLSVRLRTFSRSNARIYLPLTLYTFDDWFCRLWLRTYLEK